jgi:hypothetical protein
MSKKLIHDVDAAYQAFRALSEKLLAELAQHRALVADYEAIAELQVRAVNTGLSFVYEAACSYAEATTGKTISQIFAERGVPDPGVMVQ